MIPSDTSCLTAKYSYNFFVSPINIFTNYYIMESVRLFNEVQFRVLRLRSGFLA